MILVEGDTAYDTDFAMFYTHYHIFKPENIEGINYIIYFNHAFDNTCILWKFWIFLTIFKFFEFLNIFFEFWKFMTILNFLGNLKFVKFVTEYALTIKLVSGTSSSHSFNPYAYFGHSWSYFDIQNLPLVILLVPPHSFNPYAYFGHSWSYFDVQNLQLVILCITNRSLVVLFWCSKSTISYI